MRRSKGTVYLSGPMTGYQDFNVYAFDEARDHIMAAGYSVIVPGDDETYEPVEVDRMEVAPDKRTFYMRKDFLTVQVVTMVAVLDGWTESRGSRAEVPADKIIGGGDDAVLSAAPHSNNLRRCRRCLNWRHQ